MFKLIIYRNKLTFFNIIKKKSYIIINKNLIIFIISNVLFFLYDALHNFLN